MKNRYTTGIMLVVLLALIGSCSASTLENPSCRDLGYQYGVKYDCPGDPSLCTGSVMLDTPPFGDDTIVVSFSRDGLTFNWESVIGIDAVIVKAKDWKSYVYDPPAESFGDADLIAPDNKEISHVEFCYDGMEVPEFPAMFISLMGIAVLAGLMVFCQRK